MQASRVFGPAVIGALSVVLAISFGTLVFNGPLAADRGKGTTQMPVGVGALGLLDAAASPIRGAVWVCRMRRRSSSRCARLTNDQLERMEAEAPDLAIRINRFAAGQLSTRLRLTNNLVGMLKACGRSPRGLAATLGKAGANESGAT